MEIRTQKLTDTEELIEKIPHDNFGLILDYTKDIEELAKLCGVMWLNNNVNNNNFPVPSGRAGLLLVAEGKLFPANNASSKGMAGKIDDSACYQSGWVELLATIKIMCKYQSLPGEILIIASGVNWQGENHRKFFPCASVGNNTNLLGLIWADSIFSENHFFLGGYKNSAHQADLSAR